MSTTGKIKTLFSDIEKTEALYPRTKISAVSDENGIGLEAVLDRAAYVGEAVDSSVVPVNADTLGGVPAAEYATENFVTAKIAAAQLDGGNVDLSGYATKDDVSSAVRAIDYPVDSVNGKIGAVQLGAVDVGARPDTWMPSASEVGAAPASHATDKNNPHGVTAEQVGAAPASHATDKNNPHGVTAAQVGAAPASHATDKNNPHGVTAAQVGAAPTGYGLGDIPVNISDMNTLDNTTAPGWYRWMGGDNKLGNHFGYCALRVDSFDSTAVLQTAVETSTRSSMVRWKGYGDGSLGWSEWEWVNPPMMPGIEYRTTERWNGKVVYAKVINCGYLPKDTYNQINHGISNLGHVIVARGTAEQTNGYGYPIPFAHPTAGSMDLYVNHQQITILATKDWTTEVGYIYLEYTKR